MTKKREKPVYAFIRQGNTLRPELDLDLRALDGVANGQRVKVEVKEFRNAGRNRAYWKMLSDVVSATDCAISPERLHEVLKLELGIVDLVRLPNGMTVALPGSIAFEKMDEAEFVAFFKRAQEWLAATYGYVDERAAA
jgi:hypothetical protein